MAPLFGGLGEKLHRQPNADLSPRTDVVMGRVPGRRGGPPLPLGDTEGLQGGGFELQLERSGVALLHSASCILLPGTGGQVGLSFYLQSTSCPEAVGGVSVFLEGGGVRTESVVCMRVCLSHPCCDHRFDLCDSWWAELWLRLGHSAFFV